METPPASVGMVEFLGFPFFFGAENFADTYIYYGKP